VAKRRSFTADSFAEAKAAAAALEALIAEHPGFALAYPPLVRLYNTDFGYTGLGSSGEAERERALDLAREGLAADRGNVHAHTVLGFSYLWHDEPDLARQCFEQALALNPYNPIRLQECATGFTYMGDLERARALLDKAFELNPVPDDDCHEDRGRLLLIEGDYRAARTQLGAILKGSIWAPLHLAVCEVQLGIERGRKRFAEWRRRVEQQWHAPAAPEPAELAAWILRHHPLPPELAERFLAGINAAQAEEEMPNRPAASPRQGGG